MAKQTLRRHKKLMEAALSPPLPGLEHRAIKELEDVALQLLAIEGRKSFHAQLERELKAQAIAILHKHNKSTYRREWVDMSIEPTGEKLKVKLKVGAHGPYGPDDATDQRRPRGRPRKSETPSSRDVSDVEDTGRTTEGLPVD